METQNYTEIQLLQKFVSNVSTSNILFLIISCAGANVYVLSSIRLGT